MTDAVSDIEFFQQQMRLLEQWLCDAERMMEDLNHANDRQARDLENQRRHAMKFDDFERPEVVVQALKRNLPDWTRKRWQELADLIGPSSS